MDKYFQRIESLARMKELPARIRFMLLDLSELRFNKVSTRGLLAFSFIVLVLELDRMGVIFPATVFSA